MIAAALGRTSRWVRKWTARAEEELGNQAWAAGRSRAPLTSPTRTSDVLRQSIIDARARLVANPRGQYGPLAGMGAATHGRGPHPTPVDHRAGHQRRGP